MGDGKTCEGMKRLRSGALWGERAERCARTATVVRGGKDYCGTHDPEAREARRQKSQEKWRANHEAEMKADRIRAAAPDLLEACRGIVESFSNYEGPEEEERDDASRSRNRSVRAYEAVRAAIAKATGEVP